MLERKDKEHIMTNIFPPRCQLFLPDAIGAILIFTRSSILYVIVSLI